LPILSQKLALRFLQHAARCANDVAPPFSLEEFHVVRGNHASIQRPDVVGRAVTLFHGLDDLFERDYVRPVSGEDFISERHAASGHHQPDATLFAVAPAVPAVAAFGQGVALCVTFNIDRGHVVEKKVVFDPKQCAQPFFEKYFLR